VFGGYGKEKDTDATMDEQGREKNLGQLYEKKKQDQQKSEDSGGEESVETNKCRDMSSRENGKRQGVRREKGGLRGKRCSREGIELTPGRVVERKLGRVRPAFPGKERNIATENRKKKKREERKPASAVWDGAVP